MRRTTQHAARRRSGGPRWRGAVIGALCVCTALAVLVLTGVGLLARGLRSDRIAEGVTAAGVSLGGLTVPEAVEALEQAAATIQSETVTLEYGEDEWTATRAELGVRVDAQATAAAALEVGHTGSPLGAWRERREAKARGVEVALRTDVDEELLHETLAKLAGAIERKPEPAEVSFDRATHAISVSKDVVGRELDVDATREALTSAMDDLSRSVIPIQLRESRTDPTYEDLRHINCVLGSFTTKYSMGEASRASNIALAASMLDRVFMRPGEQISYNTVVGERTAERGYKMAHVYAEGEVRDGLGGGICQVSTTLYNAALLSGLSIVRRSPHMMPVAYVDTGRDATVDYATGIDLILRNDLPHTVQLLTFAGDGTLTCLFLGSSEDKPEKVAIERTGVSVTEFETVEQLDEDAEPGSRVEKQQGRRRFTATVWRVIKRPGQEEKRECLSSDVYAGRNQIVIVGPEAPEAESTETPAPDAASDAPAETGSDVGEPPPGDAAADPPDLGPPPEEGV